MKKVLLLAVLCLGSLAVLAGGAWGEDICVDLSGGPGVYSTNLQSALDYATTTGESNVIKVAQGMYQGNFIYAQNLGHDITLEGGYVPGTSCAQRVVNPSNPILDGLLTRRDLQDLSQDPPFQY